MKLIAEGRTAEIYEWQNDRVLKLFRHGFDNAEYESHMAKLVVQSGVKAPAIIETIEINGRPGIVYERVNGQTMLDVLRANFLSITAIAKQFADIHIRMHQRSAPELPSLKTRLNKKIRRAHHLTNEEKKRTIDYLNALPDGDRICHGDLHPENVILTPDGAKIIDWIDASSGDPAADVARSIIIMTIGDVSGNWLKKIFFSSVRSLFSYAYLKRYYALTDVSRAEVQRWMLPVAAGRLSEDVKPVEPLLHIIRRELFP